MKKIKDKIKENINKIYQELISKFKNVSVDKKSDKDGDFFLIKINDRGDWGNYKIKIIIKEKELEKDHFKWQYFSNPLDDKSDLIERYSDISSLVNHIEDIINNKRFSDEYLSLKDALKNDDNKEPLTINWVYEYVKSLSYNYVIKIKNNKVVCLNNNYEIKIKKDKEKNNLFSVKIKKLDDGAVHYYYVVPLQSLGIILSKYNI